MFTVRATNGKQIGHPVMTEEEAEQIARRYVCELKCRYPTCFITTGQRGGVHSVVYYDDAHGVFVTTARKNVPMFTNKELSGLLKRS